MIRMLTLAAVLALVAIPTRAFSYAYTCDEAAFYLENGTSQSQGAVIGHSFGVIDLLAGLQCYVGNPQCSCLANLVTNRPGDLGGEYGRRLRQCINAGQGNNPVFGVVMNTARAFCPW